VERDFAKLRNIIPLVLDACQTKKNLSKKQEKSLSKLAKLREDMKIVMCRGHDGKIVILS